MVRPRGGDAEDESGDGGSESRFREEAGEHDAAVDDSAGADAYERGDDAGGGNGEVSKSNSSMILQMMSCLVSLGWAVGLVSGAFWVSDTHRIQKVHLSCPIVN